MKRLARSLGTAVFVFVLAGCSGGMWSPAGEGARQIDSVWWLMFWLGLIPLAIVVGFIVATAVRRRRDAPGSDDPVEDPGLNDRGRTDRGLTDRNMVVYGGVVLSSLLLIPVIVITAVTQMNLGIVGEERLEVHITGHQFWWDIEYITDEGDAVRSANELHIPADTPVDLRLTSVDVIHSVWVPEIHGKMDLIPGQTNELEIHADEPGVYEGRCAEFCGLGHAMMQLLVVAHPPDEFQEWLEAEAAPVEVDAEVGVLQEFANSCAPCHTVRGVFEDPMYEGDFGPDLTHLASRRKIGANILPNTREALARWIVDPAGVKPGNRMPDVGLDADALTDILDFLDQLE